MSKPYERLSRALDKRRLDMGLQWKEVAARAGISAEALRAIRRGGSRPGELTARRLEEALGWSRGHIKAVLEEPSAPPPEPTKDVAEKDVVEVEVDDGLVMIPVPKDLSETDRAELRRWGKQMARYMAEREGERPDRNT